MRRSPRRRHIHRHRPIRAREARTQHRHGSLSSHHDGEPSTEGGRKLHLLRQRHSRNHHVRDSHEGGGWSNQNGADSSSVT